MLDPPCDVPLFSPLVSPSLSRSLMPALLGGALHLRHRCISALLLCLAPWPVWPVLSAIYIYIYIYEIVGSHLPHYHTNRPLAHSDAAFILCPSHLRLAGDQLKSGPIHERAFGRAGRGSYESAREPLAWGTRRKSIILNHGVIGSNDQATARRASLSRRGDSRGRATSRLPSRQGGEIALFPSGRDLFDDSHTHVDRYRYQVKQEAGSLRRFPAMRVDSRER